MEINIKTPQSHYVQPELFVGETADEKLGQAAYAAMSNEGELSIFRFRLAKAHGTCRIMATVKLEFQTTVSGREQNEDFLQARAYFGGFQAAWRAK